MAINFKIDFSDDILVVTSEGIDEGLEEVKNYSKAVMDYAFENNCKKVLCNEKNLEYRLTMIETYQLAEFVAENIPYPGRLAIVADEKFKEVIEFWETVSINRGVSVKAFHDYDAAMKWIKG